MNETQYIKSLLKKWEEGLSSSQEEKTLKEFFKGKDIPEELMPYKPLFIGFDSISEMEIQSIKDFSPKMDFVEREDSNIERKRIAPFVRKVAFTTVSIAAIIMAIVMIEREPLCYINGKPVHDQKTALSVIEYLDVLSTIDDMPDELAGIFNLLTEGDN